MEVSMAKATFLLPNGTNVTVEGTVEEIQRLFELYSGSNSSSVPQKTTEPSSTDVQKTMHPLPQPVSSMPKKEKAEESDIIQVVNVIKTCDLADAIEKYVLDQTNEANRALLPLFIVYEYFENAFGLTTTEISKITIELAAKVSRQNSLRALKFSVSGFVTKVGKPPRYTINRRGVAHFRALLAGTNDSQTDEVSQPVKLTPRKRTKSVKKTSTNNRGPQILILELKENGFFTEKRSISQLQKKLEEMGHIFAQTSLSGPLLKLVPNKKLNRTKEKDIWVYSA
jgi:hypothetical protein